MKAFGNRSFKSDLVMVVRILPSTPFAFKRYLKRESEMSPTEALHVHAITWSCNNELPLNKTFNNKISDALQPLKELLNPPATLPLLASGQDGGRGSPGSFTRTA